MDRDGFLPQPKFYSNSIYRQNTRSVCARLSTWYHKSHNEKGCPLVDDQVQLGQWEQMLRSVLDDKFLAFEGRMEAKLQALEDGIVTVSARVDLIKEAIEGLEEGMTDIKTALIYLQDKWIEHDKEIWRLKRKA